MMTLSADVDVCFVVRIDVKSLMSIDVAKVIAVSAIAGVIVACVDFDSVAVKVLAHELAEAIGRTTR